jgi:hypothetical protein
MASQMHRNGLCDIRSRYFRTKLARGVASPPVLGSEVKFVQDSAGSIAFTSLRD